MQVIFDNGALRLCWDGPNVFISACTSQNDWVPRCLSFQAPKNLGEVDSCAVRAGGRDIVSIDRVVGVRQGQVAQNEWVFYPYAVRNAVDGSAELDDVFPVVIAIDSNDVIPGKQLLVDPQRSGVVLFVVGGDKQGVVHENAVGIGQIVTSLVRISSIES